MNQIEQNELSNLGNEIREYFFVLRSWAWLILLIAALAGGIAYLISINTVPIYETSTRLLISEPPILRSIDYSSLVDSYYLTSTYAQMILDRPVVEGVIEALKLDMPPEDLKRLIRVEIVRDTQLLELYVRHPDPALAARIANTMAEVFTQRINELESERFAETQQSLQAQVAEMERQIELTTEAISKETDAAKQTQLEARLTEYRRLYSNLVTSYEQVRLAEAQSKTSIAVSEAAVVPTDPISPKTTQNTILAVAAGVLLGAGSIFFVNALDDTVKNPDELRERFNLPVLGMIASHKVVNGKPISEAQPRSPVAESFRTLRTNITFTAVDKPLRCLMITSPTPQVGKTTVVSNLAVVLAQGERKVLILDADLRRSQIHETFGLPNQLGLSNMFMRPMEVLLYGVVQVVQSPFLSVITSGGLPPNPSELLASEKMKLILKRLSDEYDIVLLDTPPVLTVTDAAALAPAMDGVVVVVKPGVTRFADLEQTLEQLQRVGGRVLGLVLNEVNPKSRRYGYYYSRYYSYYSYAYKGDEKAKGKAKSKKSKKPGALLKRRAPVSKEQNP